MKICTASLVLALLAAAASSQGEGPAAARLADRDTPLESQAGVDTPTGAASVFPAEQLEQIVAPIALYPDTVLAHVLMASTYPIEVVQAERWLKSKPGLAGDALEAALQEQTWDPAVKSLCGFPDVLQRMSENLDWTQDLGDAFLGQKEALMQAVQTMRRKAVDSGSLESSEELTVTEEPPQTIVIEAADPEVIYVPTYYPSVVYGSWGYPYWYYPPLYPPPPAGGLWFGFTVGVIWGGAIWGDCNWGHADIDIDIDHHHDFVDRTERSDRRQQVKDRVGARPSTGDRMANRPGTSDRASWRHDPSHRRGVGYRDGTTARQYGAGPGETRVPRDQARGFAPSTRPTTRPSDVRPTTTDRAVPTRSDVRSSSRPTTGQRTSTFSGSRDASFDRASSSRGSRSRGSMGSRGGFSRGGRRR